MGDPHLDQLQPADNGTVRRACADLHSLDGVRVAAAGLHGREHANAVVARRQTPPA